MEPPSVADIRAAALRIDDAVFRTPLVRLELDGEVYAKAENLQRTGSFKLRGAFNFLAQLTEEQRRRGVVTHSSGNHAQGVACAAYLHGSKSTVVIPNGAPPLKVERTKGWGAEIVRCENASGAREAAAEHLTRQHGYTLVPPFDHPWIIAGQGTCGLEIASELPDAVNVLVPVGGGGLISGIAIAVSELCPGARIIGVEPELAADAHASFTSGTLQSWDTAQTSRTLADGVRTESLGNLNHRVIRERVAGIVTVTEAEIVESATWYLQRSRLIVEPTGALTLAGYHKLAADNGGDLQLGNGPTVLVISGGNVDPELAARLITETA